MGETGLLTLDMLEREGVLTPGGFVGVDLEMLLPEGSEQQINADFVGVLGAFEIYRGSVRGHRMANLRIILR
jgi:hypothetical protein